MFKIRCLSCGTLEDEGVRVQKYLNGEGVPKRSETLGDQLITEYRCDPCDVVERIQEGNLPELEAEHFDSVWVDDNCSSTALLVDGDEIQFESIDEQYAENSHYTPEGIRGTSTVHHLHVHAIDPPTLSKGSHEVEIGNFIDDEFVLASIRYHDDTHRTLKFYRSVPQEFADPIRSSPSSAAQPNHSR